MKAALGYGALAVILLPFACNYDGPKLNETQRDEVSDIASSEAADAISDSSKVQELEERIEALEARVGY